jgi:hypothetical protein
VGKVTQQRELHLLLKPLMRVYKHPHAETTLNCPIRKKACGAGYDE